MQSGKPYIVRFDFWAVAVLAAGCITGLSVLILRTPSAEPQSNRGSEMRQRIHELEQRLLEQVPKSMENRYRDL
jgi:hypothetical protein